MLSLVIALTFRAPVTFADLPRPAKRILITKATRTFDDSLQPFTKAPVKCVPHPSKPMTEEQKYLAEATEQKQPWEVKAYVRCYATKNYQAYYNKYSAMIDTAAEDFGVDASLMRCLLLRESQWDASTVSCTCAMGLGQQTGDNMASMKGTIAATLSQSAWTKYMNQMRAEDPNFSKNCSGEFTHGRKAPPGSELYKSVMSGLEKECRKSPPTCPVFEHDDRRCPAASIGATAAYLKYIDSIVRKAVNCGQLEPWQMDDSRVAIALAYNAGPGTFQKAIKKANDENTTISINFLDGAEVTPRKMDEMRNHYRALRFCLHKGETDPPAANDPKNPACFESLQRQQQATGTSFR